MKLLALAVVLACLPASAFAGDVDQVAKPKKERLICRSDDDTTSRMGAHRICKTAAEWRVLDHGGSTADLAKASPASPTN